MQVRWSIQTEGSIIHISQTHLQTMKFILLLFITLIVIAHGFRPLGKLRIIHHRLCFLHLMNEASFHDYSIFYPIYRGYNLHIIHNYIL